MCVFAAVHVSALWVGRGGGKSAIRVWRNSLLISSFGVWRRELRIFLQGFGVSKAKTMCFALRFGSKARGGVCFASR